MSPKKLRNSVVPFVEKSLAEFGYASNAIPLWDQTEQPAKPDIYELLHNMIETYSKTNVQIHIEGTIFNCHMLVLQCYSDYFTDRTNEHTVILPANKVTPHAFVIIYNWMLTHEPKVKRECILELFCAAQFLQIKPLVDQCWVCLDDKEMFREEAAFMLYLEARVFGSDFLLLIRKLMLRRICKFFLTLVASQEFLDLTIEEVCMLLNSNSIGVNSETEVMFSAVRWLSKDWVNRESCLVDIMRCVRFGLMAPWQLVELSKKFVPVELEKIVDNTYVREMIEDGFSYVTTKYWRSSNIDEFTHMIERLNLTEPVDRHWVHDQAWIENQKCANLATNSYKIFLKYLETIRGLGRDYWKSLRSYEGNPILKSRINS